MLQILDCLLRLCKEESESALREHDMIFARNGLTTECLLRNFASLHRKKMPIRDPLMPDDVRHAKHYRYKMTKRAESG